MADGLRQPARILEAGQNCWKAVCAPRAALLVDGDAYFSALASSFARAQRRITILGWDFDSRIRLCPRGNGTALGVWLRRLVEERPDLEVYIQVWRNAILYADNSELPELLEPEWSDHPRIRFRTDDHHPVGACRHAKVVCIDGKIAFAGGMDLTRARWDESDHRPDNPWRVDAAGKSYPPTHDVQMVVDGAAGEALCRLAEARWQELTGEALPPCQGDADPWPDGVRALVRDQTIGIARTVPLYGDREEVREVETLSEDAFLAARKSIYVETQYFALPRIAEILADHLIRPDGPEVVLVINEDLHGKLEHYAMAGTRDRLLGFLHRADRHGRLRAYRAVARADPACPILLHAKVTVIDDHLLRVGSANLNVRSTGFDDECDLALESCDERGRMAVTRARNTLLAEHLGTTPRRVAEAVRRHGSVIAAIEALNKGPRRLVEYEITDERDRAQQAPGSALLDPPRPIDLGTLVKGLKSIGQD